MARTIFLIDFDSYFASIEQQCNPLLRGRPIGVSRKPYDYTVVAAASREAKRFGVKSGMSSWEAKRLCPQIELVAGDPAKYTYATSRALRLCKQYTPDIEPFSIDEAFLDVTSAVQHRYGRDPVALAKALKRDLRRALGPYVTCSIGIAPSKVLSKLCVEWQKPDGITVITPEEVPGVLARTKVTEVCGIAEGIGRRLGYLGVRTMAELGACPIERLTHEFGVIGAALQTLGQGRDPAPVNPNLRFAPPKSYSHSRVITREFGERSWRRVQPVLSFLCYKAARRMRAEGYAGRVVYLYTREAVQGDMPARQVAKQFTLAVPTIDERVILRTCGQIAALAGGINWEIGLIGMAVSGLRKQAGMTLPLFEADRKRDRLLRAMDKINDTYEEFTVTDGLRRWVKEAVNWEASSLGRHREIEF
jgi:DNA polymerase-4